MGRIVPVYPHGCHRLWRRAVNGAAGWDRRFVPADRAGHARSASGSFQLLRTHAWPLFVVGILNSAAPFCLFAYAELTLSAGVTSVINATTPLWGGLVAFLWLRDRLSAMRTLGLVIGFLGVLMLVWDQIAAPNGSPASPMTTALAAGA